MPLHCATGQLMTIVVDRQFFSEMKNLTGFYNACALLANQDQLAEG